MTERLLSDRQRTKLSKFMSLILRHEPGRFGVTLAPEGFTGLSDLIEAISSQRSWVWIREEHIREVVRTSPKNRFEIRDDRIRARYGHSVETVPSYRPVEPPPTLFHGTPRSAVENIMREGLQPQSRQFVHLSATRDAAIQVGRRRDSRPAVLTIQAEKAAESGVQFFQATDTLYLCTPIPPQFIDRVENERV